MAWRGRREHASRRPRLACWKANCRASAPPRETTTASARSCPVGNDTELPRRRAAAPLFLNHRRPNVMRTCPIG